MIETLVTLKPDAARTAKTMARCHATLAARRRQTEARHRRSSPRFLTVEKLLLTGACAIYLFSMASDLLTIATSR